MIGPLSKISQFLPQREHHTSTLQSQTSLEGWWSEFLTTSHEVPGSIPGSTMCVFP